MVIIRTNENVITIKQPIWNKIYQKTRTESDLIGSREVPESALYGVQTLRGIENFRISKFHLNEYPLFIQALAITKMGATVANRELDLLTEEQADAILRACKEILEGKHHEQFPVDMIQEEPVRPPT